MSKDRHIQLFLLPYAGGSSFSFMKVTRFLDSDIEAITIEYSGRGSRKEKPFIDDYETFLNDVVDQINDKRNKKLPYVLLGYSMGSALAFDIVSRGLLDAPPIYCFFCAEGSPIRDNAARKLAYLEKQEFTEKILLMGGIDNKLKSNPVLLDETIDLIFRDYIILGMYQYSGKRCESSCSIIFNYEDWTCSNVEDWSAVIAGDVEYINLGKGHFFINNCYKEIAEIINRKLKEICGDSKNASEIMA